MNTKQKGKKRCLKKGSHLIKNQLYFSFEKPYERIKEYILNPTSYSLHTFIELSQYHLKSLKNNMIILSYLIIQKFDSSQKNVENHVFLYKAIEVGKNVHLSSISHVLKLYGTPKHVRHPVSQPKHVEPEYVHNYVHMSHTNY